MRLLRSTAPGAEELAIEIGALGLGPGDRVLVEADLDSIGTVIGGTRAVIEALIHVVGDHGLIMMPAFSSDALMPPVDIDSDWQIRERVEARVPGFDPLLSPADISGPLAEAFRTWPGVERSFHPVFSLTAYGERASQIVAQHPRDWAMGPEGPLGRLLEAQKPKVLSLGRPWRYSAAMTMAETMARHRRLRVIRFKDAARQPARWVHARDVARDGGAIFSAVGAAFHATGRMTVGPVGACEAGLYRLDTMLAFAAPTIAAQNAAQNAQGYPSYRSQAGGPAETAKDVEPVLPRCDRRSSQGMPVRT
ncbi:MAG: AAC(3) family N-acetyltransferase [Pseudomonadota bacterium]